MSPELIGRLVAGFYLLVFAMLGLSMVMSNIFFWNNERIESIFDTIGAVCISILVISLFVMAFIVIIG